MSGTPVLLDVTDTPGERERQASVRQQPPLQQQPLPPTPASGGAELQKPGSRVRFGDRRRPREQGLGKAKLQSARMSLSSFVLDTSSFRLPPETNWEACCHPERRIKSPALSRAGECSRQARKQTPSVTRQRERPESSSDGNRATRGLGWLAQGLEAAHNPHVALAVPKRQWGQGEASAVTSGPGNVLKWKRFERLRTRWPEVTLQRENSVSKSSNVVKKWPNRNCKAARGTQMQAL